MWKNDWFWFYLAYAGRNQNGGECRYGRVYLFLGLFPWKDGYRIGTVSPSWRGRHFKPVLSVSCSCRLWRWRNGRLQVRLFPLIRLHDFVCFSSLLTAGVCILIFFHQAFQPRLISQLCSFYWQSWRMVLFLATSFSDELSVSLPLPFLLLSTNSLSSNYTCWNFMDGILYWLSLRDCSCPTFFMPAFSCEASHTYFFRREVSASRILQVPDALFPGFFQKLFADGLAAGKNFSRLKGEIIR